MLLLRNGKSFLKALTYRQKKCLFRKLFDRESFSSGIKSFIQKNISWGKSDKISKKLKTFSVDVFLDKVISSLSLSLSVSLPLSLLLSLPLQIKHKYSCQRLKQVHVKLLQIDHQWEKSIWDLFQSLQKPETHYLQENLKLNCFQL